LKRNIFLIFLLVILAGAAWWTWNRNQQKSTLNKLDLNFSVPDTASIDQIVISPQGKGYEKAILKRISGSEWRLNDKYKVAPTLMELLLTTIRNVEMKRPVDQNEAKMVLEEIKTKGKKVEIYVSGKLYKTYWVGADEHNFTGTYFKFEEGNPYVCHLRGFLGFLSPRYDVTENDWRDKLLFNSEPQSLESIEIQYTSSPVDNFKLVKLGKNMVLSGNLPFDTSAANSYAGLFKKWYVERHMAYLPQTFKDSILKTKPEWQIEVRDKKQDFSHLVVFYDVKDENRQLGHIPARQDWFTVQSINLLPLKIRKRDLLGFNP
jgi:hypothetical protein